MGHYIRTSHIKNIISARTSVALQNDERFDIEKNMGSSLAIQKEGASIDFNCNVAVHSMEHYPPPA